MYEEKKMSCPDTDCNTEMAGTCPSREAMKCEKTGKKSCFKKACCDCSSFTKAFLPILIILAIIHLIQVIFA